MTQTNTDAPTPEKHRAKVVLSIAGSDSSAGAGIAADIKTGAAFGVFVSTAITAITAQNSYITEAIYPVCAQQLNAQLSAIRAGMPIDAIKLGMLGNTHNLKTVSDFLRALKEDGVLPPVVIDPVLGATSGGELWADSTSNPCMLYQEYLLPYATLITPNVPEAARLLNETPAHTYHELEQQAQRLQQWAGTHVLLKGGHMQTPLATDYLVEHNNIQPFTGPRISTEHSHGSGCTLATAIAAGLAQALSLKQAVAAAKNYMQGALTNSQRLALTNANGPIHHFYSYW